MINAKNAIAITNEARAYALQAVLEKLSETITTAARNGRDIVKATYEIPSEWCDNCSDFNKALTAELQSNGYNFTTLTSNNHCIYIWWAE